MNNLCAESFAGARDLFEISVPAMQAMFNAMNSAPGFVAGRQAGAGFGGCLIALVDRNRTREFCRHVAGRYQGTTEVKPKIYCIETAPGAGPLVQSRTWAPPE